MARKQSFYGNIFSESKRDSFVVDSLNAQSSLSKFQNPYVGNKRKMLCDIALSIYDYVSFDEVDSVCDLFAGSGVVGAFFKKINKTVYSNELLYSSYANLVYFLHGYNFKINDEEIKFLLNNQSHNDGFIERQYAGKRFTIKESQFIDNYYKNTQLLFNKKEQFLVANAILLQFIMSYCFLGGRLNNGQIIASLEHRLEHQRNNNLELNFNKISPTYINYPEKESFIFNNNVFDFLSNIDRKIDLFYIDPPYGGSQSDYAYMYSFFEEYFARKPIDQIEYLSESANLFINSKSYQDSFNNLMERLPQNSIWVLSYNDLSWSDINNIESSIKKYRKEALIKEINYDYKYRSKNNSSGKEYIILSKN